MNRIGIVGFAAALAACQVTGLTGPRAPSAPAPSSTSSDPPTTSSSSSSVSAAASGDDRATADSGASESITIPDVMGLSRADAEAKLRAAGVRGDLELKYDANLYDFNVAKVCDVQPVAGSHTGSRLSVTVDYCPQRVRQDRVDAARNRRTRSEGDNLIGMTVEDAKRRLAEAGWDQQIDVFPQRTYDASCKPNRVCSVQSLGSTFTLYVTKAPSKISDPD